MLPAKELAPPGATEQRRSFEEAVDGTTVDGATIDRPATLLIKYSLPSGMTFEQVQAWYQDALALEGWTITSDPATTRSLTLRAERDSFVHELIVEQIGDDSAFFVRYLIGSA
jgi:hypothetical protein